MIALDRSRWAGIDSWAGQPLYSLSSAVEEGMALCAAAEGGLTKANVVASIGSSDIFMGLAYNYYTSPTSLIMVETQTVPASGSYVLTLANTPLNGTTDVLVKDSTGQVYAYNSAHGANQYAISSKTVTFDSSAAGKVVTFTYAYTPTVPQVQALFGDGVAGHSTAADVTGTIGLIRRGLIYTTNFDPLIDWSALPAINVGNAGILTSGGSGPTLNGYVYEVPSADSPFLGINFSAA